MCAMMVSLKCYAYIYHTIHDLGHNNDILFDFWYY